MLTRDQSGRSIAIFVRSSVDSLTVAASIWRFDWNQFCMLLQAQAFRDKACNSSQFSRIRLALATVGRTCKGSFSLLQLFLLVGVSKTSWRRTRSKPLQIFATSRLLCKAPIQYLASDLSHRQGALRSCWKLSSTRASHPSQMVRQSERPFVREAASQISCSNTPR